jgi:hypothetical protein
MDSVEQHELLEPSGSRMYIYAGFEQRHSKLKPRKEQIKLLSGVERGIYLKWGGGENGNFFCFTHYI